MKKWLMLSLVLSGFAQGKTIPLSGTKAQNLANALSRVGAFHSGSIKAGFAKQDVSDVLCRSVVSTKAAFCQFTDNKAIAGEKKTSMSSQQGPEFAGAVKALMSALREAGIRQQVLLDVVKISAAGVRCDWKFFGLNAREFKCEVTL